MREGRERRFSDSEEEKEGETNYSTSGYRLEKSDKITMLHFSLRATPTPGRAQRATSTSTSTVTRDAAAYAL